MFTVLINDKKFCAEDGEPLKDILLLCGMQFPCNREECGQCVIACPDLPISALDRRFLSADKLSAGHRLACDKTVTKSLVVTCPLPEENNIAPLSSCDAAIVIGDDLIDVTVCDKNAIETRAVAQPLLSYGDVASQAEAYEKNPAAMRETLRATIKNKLDFLLKRYGLTKAGTTAVCASEFYLKILFGVPQNTKIENYRTFVGNDVLGLPTEKIYVLPPLGAFTSGEIFCQSTTKPENSFLLDCEKNLTLFYIGKEDNVFSFMWDVDYSELSALIVRAAIRVIKPADALPIVYLYGENAYKLEGMLTEEGLSYVHAEKDADAVCKACGSLSFRSRLEKEKERTSFHDLLKDENFQEEMNNVYLYTE